MQLTLPTVCELITMYWMSTCIDGWSLLVLIYMLDVCDGLLYTCPVRLDSSIKNFFLLIMGSISCLRQKQKEIKSMTNRIQINKHLQKPNILTGLNVINLYYKQRIYSSHQNHIIHFLSNNTCLYIYTCLRFNNCSQKTFGSHYYLKITNCIGRHGDPGQARLSSPCNFLGFSRMHSHAGAR